MRRSSDSLETAGEREIIAWGSVYLCALCGPFAYFAVKIFKRKDRKEKLAKKTDYAPCVVRNASKHFLAVSSSENLLPSCSTK